MRSLRKKVRDHDVSDWSREFLEALDAVRRARS